MTASATSRLSKLLHLTRRQHMYLFAATFHLVRARIDLGRKPAKDIIGELRHGEPALRHTSAAIDVQLMSWAIRAAASGVPWRSDCLIQSLAASRWLRRSGISPDFRLGVNSSADGILLAHAWIEHDGIVLTGGNDVEAFNILIGS